MVFSEQQSTSRLLIFVLYQSLSLKKRFAWVFLDKISSAKRKHNNNDITFLHVWCRTMVEYHTIPWLWVVFLRDVCVWFWCDCVTQNNFLIYSYFHSRTMDFSWLKKQAVSLLHAISLGGRPIDTRRVRVSYSPHEANTISTRCDVRIDFATYRTTTVLLAMFHFSKLRLFVVKYDVPKHLGSFLLIAFVLIMATTIRSFFPIRRNRNRSDVDLPGISYSWISLTNTTLIFISFSVLLCVP